MTAILLLSFSVALYSQENDVDEARSTIEEYVKNDPGMDKFFSSAVGYAVFPGIGKGGLGVGGAAGKGTVFKDGAAVAEVKMTRLTVVFQAGGQKYAEIIFFETEETYNEFISGN